MTLGLIVACAILSTGAYGLSVSVTSSFVSSPLQGFMHKPMFHLRTKNIAPRWKHNAKSPRAMLDVRDLFNGADPPPESVLRAVESAGRRVTVADIASAVGMSLTDSQKPLSTLAMLTSGTLAVSNDGEIVYIFDPNFRNILQTRSIDQIIHESNKLK
jgi:hypothetical protein